MMDKNQSQQAGDNSRQYQLENCTVIVGIDEKRAREIALEIFEEQRKRLTLEARETAMKRVQQFTDELIPKMQKVENVLNAFAEPAFQFLLTEAQKTAAKTEHPADYEILAELLIRRIKTGSNRNVHAGISRAIEIVDEVSDEALLGLTTSFLMEYFTPISGIISKGLNDFNKVFQSLIYGDLPIDSEWIENLEVLRAVRISVLSMGQKKYEDYFAEKMPGYCAVGIKKCSEAHNKAQEMIKEVGIPHSFLCDHELNTGYVRLAIANEKYIDNPEFSNLNDEQKQILHKIFAMYETDKSLKEKIKSNLCAKLNAHKFLNAARTWWNNFPIFYQITPVGKSLAYANAKRVYPQLPQLK